MAKRLIVILVIILFSGFIPSDEIGLKTYFEDDFRVGTAVNLAQVSGKEPGADSLLSLHYNSITSENGLKWALVHPHPDQYDFAFGDAFVAMGEKLGAFTVGHTLVWHQQTPTWVFKNELGQPLDREALLARMEEHISTVMGRYRGRIQGWDVVNEVFEDDGTWRKSPWYILIGPDFVERAFRKAQEMDPKAALYYNDYNVWKPEKRAAILALAKDLRAKGIRIDGIGMQGHYRLQVPSLDQIEQAILEIHQAGFEVHITELDVDVLPRPSDSAGADLNVNYAASPEWNPYVSGIPKEVEKQLVERYAGLMKLFKKHGDKIERVTFWGMHDGRTWLNNWPVRGRTNYPLLFDREKRIKPGFWEAMEGK
ncbi:1,4-beta-xylanase [Algoriphagus lacus]|uniref:Beta-xylanase n=1 Tax=Algoriphagus lacus TaxID=2056311 RepID=A0A418PVB5_9BACT|nr:endo-1,4-beta-xylanase [Algoriphagus lacus]RIW17522.1 1,4-beta-xylanase [Algoriphagus lacus]